MKPFHLDIINFHLISFLLSNPLYFYMNLYLFQQEYSVFFDLDILKSMRHLIASTPGITVYAPMLTATIQVHSIVRRKDPFRLYKVHPSMSLPKLIESKNHNSGNPMGSRNYFKISFQRITSLSRPFCFAWYSALSDSSYSCVNVVSA